MQEKVGFGESRRPRLREVFRIAKENFQGDRLRFLLTALGIVIGTASLMLVTTVALAGKRFLLDEIQSIGSNLIYAENARGDGRLITGGDALTLGDMQAVQQQVSGIVAASPVLLPLMEHVSIGGGRVRNLQVMGVYPEYKDVRKLVITAGRFFDDQDSGSRSKVAIINAPLAAQLFGSEEAAVGRTVKVENVPFTILGSFREQVDTFGQTEVTDITMLVPFSVIREFQQTPTIKQIFFSADSASSVGPLSAEVRKVIQSRHRPQAEYSIRNLTQLVSVANKIAWSLTILLLGVSIIVLLVSGIGIMNTMLDSVAMRIQEIGVRKAVGARPKDILLQFLAETGLIALGGAAIGITVGMIIPLLLRLFTPYRIPISGSAALLAVAVCCVVEIGFGTLPALRAARITPIDSLRYE
jgi:putative ABC transport system permease protein